MPTALQQLYREAAMCTLCPRLCDKQAVLSARNGYRSAAVMFIAEAPGRLGADRTRIPLAGDATGRNFEELLAAVGLSRKGMFVTNAVLCNPRDPRGRNARPNSTEIVNCSAFLRRQIELVNPRVIVTLGQVALHAVNLILGANFNLREAVGRAFPVGHRILIPLYHPSPRVLNIHRKRSQQIRDYQAIAACLGAPGQFSLPSPELTLPRDLQARTSGRGVP